MSEYKIVVVGSKEVYDSTYDINEDIRLCTDIRGFKNHEICDDQFLQVLVANEVNRLLSKFTRVEVYEVRNDDRLDELVPLYTLQH